MPDSFYTRFNISLPKHLLTVLDEAAALEYSNRSEFIRQAVVRRLEKLQASARIELEASTDEQLEAAFTAIRQERARRLARKELAEMRRQRHAGRLKDEP